MTLSENKCGQLLLRSSHRRCSVRKGVFRSFAKLTGKHLCQNLFFNKVAGLRPVNFAKFLRTPFIKTSLVAASEKKLTALIFRQIHSLDYLVIYRKDFQKQLSRGVLRKRCYENS